jgi:hypothetical protein
MNDKKPRFGGVFYGFSNPVNLTNGGLIIQPDGEVEIRDSNGNIADPDSAELVRWYAKNGGFSGRPRPSDKKDKITSMMSYKRSQENAIRHFISVDVNADKYGALIFFSCRPTRVDIHMCWQFTVAPKEGVPAEKTAWALCCEFAKNYLPEQSVCIITDHGMHTVLEFGNETLASIDGYRINFDKIKFMYASSDKPNDGLENRMMKCVDDIARIHQTNVEIGNLPVHFGTVRTSIGVCQVYEVPRERFKEMF